MLLGIILGVLIGFGIAQGKAADVAFAGYVFQACDLIGGLFMNALKMLVVPLVAASIISSIAGLGNTAGFGRLGGKTLLFYVCTSLCAILIGLVLVNGIGPGEGVDLSTLPLLLQRFR